MQCVYRMVCKGMKFSCLYAALITHFGCENCDSYSRGSCQTEKQTYNFSCVKLKDCNTHVQKILDFQKEQ